MGTSGGEDPYRRFDYRRLIAWPERVARERPFLEQQLRQAPVPSLLDLGCGTGEHSALFASLGIATTGVDRSEEMIERARDHQDRHPPNGPRFVIGDFERLPELVDESFGAAICLGNVVPHIEDDRLDACLTAWAARLVPGGRLILQLLNYERILERGIRHLPLNFRDDPEGRGEIVFLRLMRRHGERHVLFCPTTLRLVPEEETPVEVHATRSVVLRAWRLAELEERLEAAGFRRAEVYGDMTGGDYRPLESTDLVVVAVRDAGRRGL